MEPLFTRHLRNERNKRVFQNISEDNTIVWDSFLFLIVSWCKKMVTFIVFLLNFCVVIYEGYSYLMRRVIFFISNISFCR